MVPPRAYVPSAALIRALARPQPLRCPFARPLPTQFVRGKKSKAAKAREAEKAQLAQQARRERHAEMTAAQKEAEAEKESEAQFHKDMKKDKKFAAAAGPLMKMVSDMHDPNKIDKFLEPPPDNVFEDGEDPGIYWYEEDPATGERRQVDRFGTVADRKRERETHRMIEKSYEDPDYDDAELNRRLMDTLITNPAFADLTTELKEIKESILSKEEEKEIAEEAQKAAQPEIEQMNAAMRIAYHDSITKLVNDPDVGDAKPQLQAVLDKLSETEDIHDPEFQAVIDVATEKVKNTPKLQAKLDASRANETEQDRQKWADLEKKAQEMYAAVEEEDLDEDDELNHEEIDDLMRQMRDILRNQNTNGDLEAEMTQMLAQPTPRDMYADDDQDTVNAKVDAELARLAGKFAKSLPGLDNLDDNEEHIPPELQAKVDKIMEDPRLLEKLAHIQTLIAEHTPKRDPNDLTQIDHELAPDPYEMDDSRTTTIAQRMAAARADPEHAAAMHSLRVKLPPPFNISPALKSFNQAIEFAYIGANDDVRRVLWRSYQKARSLPTFLINVSDDAWDILYYSQAVKWSGNQNRTDHLRLLLADLAKVGKKGPPTHPSDLGQHAEAARLEAAQKEAALGTA